MQTALHFPDQVVVGIDARDGRVAIEGWTETTHIQAIDLAKRFEDCGVAAINFTDIYRDGMQTGPNITETGRPCGGDQHTGSGFRRCRDHRRHKKPVAVGGSRRLRSHHRQGIIQRNARF